MFEKIAHEAVGYELKGGPPSAEPVTQHPVPLSDVVSRLKGYSPTLSAAELTRLLEAELQEAIRQQDTFNTKKVSEQIFALAAARRERLLRALLLIQSL